MHCIISRWRKPAVTQDHPFCFRTPFELYRVCIATAQMSFALVVLSWKMRQQQSPGLLSLCLVICNLEISREPKTKDSVAFAIQWMCWRKSHCALQSLEIPSNPWVPKVKNKTKMQDCQRQLPYNLSWWFYYLLSLHFGSLMKMGCQGNFVFGLTKDGRFSIPTLAAGATGAFVSQASLQEQTLLQTQHICTDQGPTKEIF